MEDNVTYNSLMFADIAKNITDWVEARRISTILAKKWNNTKGWGNQLQLNVNAALTELTAIDYINSPGGQDVINNILDKAAKDGLISLTRRLSGTYVLNDYPAPHDKLTADDSPKDATKSSVDILRSSKNKYDQNAVWNIDIKNTAYGLNQTVTYYNADLVLYYDQDKGQFRIRAAKVDDRTKRSDLMNDYIDVGSPINLPVRTVRFIYDDFGFPKFVDFNAKVDVKPVLELTTPEAAIREILNHNIDWMTENGVNNDGTNKYQSRIDINNKILTELVEVFSVRVEPKNKFAYTLTLVYSNAKHELLRTIIPQADKDILDKYIL